jgi:hypothetical protein
MNKLYDECMDKEVLPLCDALNSIKGIETTSSCCGHGKETFRVWFKCSSLKIINNLIYWIKQFRPLSRWEIKVFGICSNKRKTHFMIEGPKGEAGYRGSKIIAKRITGNKKYISEKPSKYIDKVEINLGVYVSFNSNGKPERILYID